MKASKLYRLLTVLVALTLFSCEDFLDLNPLDKMSNETFWTSEKEVQMALTGCYRRLRDEPFFAASRVLLDALTDNAQYKWSGNPNLLEISRGMIETTTGGVISSIWGSAYKGISTCNNFMENVDKAPLGEEDLRRYKGEVRFLRAFFYFELVHYFGDVILYRENPKTISESKLAQSPRAEVLGFIHTDLDSAIAALPDDRYDKGHAVRGSAMALKARVLIFEERFEEAAQITEEIILSGRFRLDANYRELFLYRPERSREIMFSTRYMNPDDYSDLDVMLILWAGSMPRQELADAYECTDGLSIAESPLYDSVNPYAQRDPRLGMSLMVPGEIWLNPNGTQHHPDPSQTGLFQKKYVDSLRLPISTSTRSDQDYIHIRYADVLLMHAEARNEVSGPVQSVYDAVNAVRDRVDMPDLPAGLSQSEMRERIRHERRIELALEGLRYYDLKRWKIAHTVMPQVHDVGDVPIVFENPKHYLWPYQQSELEVNPNLVPNPDYIF
mgnify:CR=1 FL=1